MQIELAPQHHWLAKLVGEWEIESECQMGPDQPVMKSSGTEVVRSVGGLWIVGHGKGEMPEGVVESVLTLGFDPQKNRFVGTFIASMMTHLWPYEGTLDAAGRVLTLDSHGPGCTGDGTMSKYQDIFEIVNDNYRTLKSQYEGPDGKWVPFLTAHYRRT